MSNNFQAAGWLRLSLALACLVLTVPVLPAAPLSAPEVKALLERIREKRNAAPHVQADFHEEKVIRLMNKPISSSGKVWFQPPNKFRREVRGSAPSVMVSDGQQLWIYYPNFKSAEHYSLGKRSPLDAGIAAINTALNLENVEGTFHISGVRTDHGYDLVLLPKAPSMKRLFQKFDLHVDDDLLAERTEMLQPNGDRIVTTYSNQSRAPIPPATFEFTPPAGTDVTTPLGR
jgi:outer membrane lipoprotein carrier protein